MATHPEQTEWWLSAGSAVSLAALTELLLASANQANQALVRELRKGWRWAGSDRVQGPTAPRRAAAGPAMPQ